MSVSFRNQNSDSFTDLYYEDILGCISRLDKVHIGGIWTLEQIKEQKESLLEEGRDWIAVDNLPVHEEIKRGGPTCYKFIENYKESLLNLSKSGVSTVCYNFTPLYYKLRTHFSERLGDKHAFSFFDPVAFSVFDMYVLNRPSAHNSYNGYQRHKANILYRRLTECQLTSLTTNIFEGLPSVEKGSLDDLNQQLLCYSGISNEEFSYNFKLFRSEIAALAKDLKIRLHINPDDPCGNLFGLPQILNSV